MNTFFTLGRARSFRKERDIVSMVCHQIFTGLREQALLSGAGSLCHLLFAGREPEIGRRAAHIVDIALKIRLLRQKLCLLHNGFMASGLDDPPLMEGQGTEAAAAEAAPVADQAELHLTDGRNAAQPPHRTDGSVRI